MAILTRVTFAKECNVSVYNTKTLTQVYKFVSECEKDYSEIVHWSHDDNLLSLFTTKNEIALSSMKKQQFAKIQCKNILMFTISSNFVVLSVELRESLSIMVYDLLKCSEAIHKFEIPNAQEAQFKWNFDKSHLLIISDSIEDKSGESYYGKQSLYILNVGAKIIHMPCTL